LWKDQVPRRSGEKDARGALPVPCDREKIPAAFAKPDWSVGLELSREAFGALKVNELLTTSSRAAFQEQTWGHARGVGMLIVAATFGANYAASNG
jgi:hypothetical protein